MEHLSILCHVMGCLQSEMDWEVGEVMAALKEAGVDKNTFVFLTSDNGQVSHY